MVQHFKQEPSNEHLSQSFILIRFDQSLKDANDELKARIGTPDWVFLVQLVDGAIVGAPFLAISQWIRDRQRLDIGLADLLETEDSPLVPIEKLDQFEPDLSHVSQKAGHNHYGLVAIEAFGNIVSVYMEKPLLAAEQGSYPSGLHNAVIGDNLSPTRQDTLTKAKTFYEKWKIGIIIATIWFIATTIVSFVFPLLQTNLSDLLPSLFPTVMTGEWNLVVAGFTPEGEGSVSSKDAAYIGEVYYNHFAGEIENLGTEIGLHVQILGPSDTPRITGRTAEDREAKASSLAEKMKADMVVYGTIERHGEGYILKPEFFVNTRNFYEASEMVGQHVLGSAIRLFGIGQDLYTQINLNKELSNRSQVLALIAKGLGLYLTHQYDDALEMFTQANLETLWEIDSGREVVYLFVGNAALRADQLQLAQTAYQNALTINPQYSRGYAGLGSTYYLMALQEERGQDDPQTGVNYLEQALDYYQKALDAEHQPSTADIPTKVALGKGIVYLTQWLSGGDTLEPTRENFNMVIEEYEQRGNERVQEAASEAHAHLGMIARQDRDTTVAIQEYSSAVELATNPARRGLYWSILGTLYHDQNESELSYDGYTKCVVEYKNALGLTVQAERRAGYWGKIGTCYESLGNIPEAVNAIEQALRYAPGGSEEYLKFESLLQELQTTQAE